MKNKKIEVRYFSRTGNTAKLANTIARTAGCEAKTTDIFLKERADILFIGASVYGAGIDKNVKDFIESLDGSKVGIAVIFSTSALVERAYPEIKKHLSAKGIRVASEDFYCRGQFTFLHKNRPNDQDLVRAKQFTEKMIEESSL